MRDKIKRPQVSVVVPVYNVEKYISRCIESIINQTFQDFELILINDGSQDKSGEICNRYQELDNRIIVIHKENGGVSSARNMGLQTACGDYIVFVDSDDQVETDYLWQLMQSDADLVISGVKNVSCAGGVNSIIHYNNKELISLDIHALCDMCDNKSLNYNISKRFSKEIITRNKIYFDEEMSLGEDTLFVARYLCHCDNIEYKDADTYIYYKYEHDTLSSFSWDYITKLECVNEKIENVLSQRFEDIGKKISWKRRQWSIYYYSIFFVLQSDYSILKKRKILHDIFNRKEINEYLCEIDYYMARDSKLIRLLISTRNEVIVLVVWEILKVYHEVRDRKNKRL